MAKKPATAPDKPRKTRKVVEEIELDDEPEDELDELQDAPVDDLQQLLDELGGDDSAYCVIYRVDKSREYVGRYEASNFNVEDFADEYGGGDYEMRFYRSGQQGIQARKVLRINKARKPRVPMPQVEPKKDDDFKSLCLSMIQQQGEIMRAIATGRSAPVDINGQLVSAMLNRREPDTLETLLKFKQAGFLDGTDSSAETNMADVLAKGLDTLGRYAAAKELAKAQAGKPRPAPGVKKPALARPEHKPAPEGQETAPASKIPSGGRLDVMQAVGQLSDLLDAAQADPNPVAVVYAGRIISRLGMPTVDAICEKFPDEGQLAEMVSMVAPTLDEDFLGELEGVLFEQVNNMRERQGRAPIVSKPAEETDPTPPASSAALRIDNQDERTRKAAA